MQAFMLYMSGGGVQIFSMGIVFMLLLTPFKNLAAINTGTCVPGIVFDTRANIPASFRAFRANKRACQVLRDIASSETRLRCV